MNTDKKIDPALRDAVLARPQDILDDRDMMQALIESNERRMGENIVDLRGVAMDRLETRLDRLEDTHRSVIAAAYDNVAGTNQIHRAVLRLLETEDLGTFVAALNDEVAGILRIDGIRLVLEVSGESPLTEDGHGVLKLAGQGFIDDYLGKSVSARARDVTLRAAPPASRLVFGDGQQAMRSEACIRLDLGAPDVCGMLVLGARDASMFTPQQGTDLLGFLGGVVSRLLSRAVL